MSENIIETRDLTKQYGTFTAVNHLSLTVRRGEVFGLLGPNGAGKTTTILMLLGLTEPTDGVAAISGIDCTRHPIRVKRFVGYLADNMGFYPDMTGRENLRFTGRINGLEPELLEARIDELLRRVNMIEAADRKTGTYSKGMKQRLGIADILIKDPDILIMDEPTNGIDPEGIRELMRLIRDLAVKDGKTILISSHQLHQIQQICDRVGIFVGGQLVVCGTIAELAGQLEAQNGLNYQLSTSPMDTCISEKLLALDSVNGVEIKPDHMVVNCSGDAAGLIAETVVKNGYALNGLTRIGSDLDDIYSKYFVKAGEKDADVNHGKRRWGAGRPKN